MNRRRPGLSDVMDGPTTGESKAPAGTTPSRTPSRASATAPAGIDDQYVTMSARVPARLKQRFKARAVAEDRNMRDMVVEALEQYLAS